MSAGEGSIKIKTKDRENEIKELYSMTKNEKLKQILSDFNNKDQISKEIE